VGLNDRDRVRPLGSILAELRILREAAAYETSGAGLDRQSRLDCMAVTREHEEVEALGFDLLLAEDVHTFLRAVDLHDASDGR
jgi:hypothetical protein